MPDIAPVVRWDRVLRRWWLPVILGLVGLAAVPLALGSGYTARLSLAPRGDLSLPRSDITISGAELTAVMFAEVGSLDVEAAVRNEVGHGMGADVVLAGKGIVVSVGATTEEAVRGALQRYEALARTAMGDEVRIRTMAQKAVVDARIISIKDGIAEIDRQLAGVDPADTVMLRSLVVDRGELVVELASTEATSSALATAASSGHDFVALTAPANVEPRGGFVSLAALGLLGGAVLGAALALVLARRDRRVRGRRDIDPLSGAHLVAALGPLDSAPARRELATVAAVAAASVRAGSAERVVLVPWDSVTSGDAAARLHAEDWYSVECQLVDPVGESPAAFALALGSVVVLCAPTGTVDERRLAEIASKFEAAGAADVQVVLVGLAERLVDAATRA